jgi:hypothetical protein
MKKIDNLAQLYAIALGNWNVCHSDENTKIKEELERQLLEVAKN